MSWSPTTTTTLALLLVTALVGACTGTSEEGADNGRQSKEQGRENSGRTESGVDLCDALSWYGDGSCDPFCPQADPDCGGGDACEELGWYGDGTCDRFCEQPDPDCETNAGCQSDNDCEPGFTCQFAEACPDDDQGCIDGRFGQCVERITTPCSPQDIRLVGEASCDQLFGVVWTGNSCEPVYGCDCIGADCEQLSETPEECLDRFGACGLDPNGGCGRMDARTLDPSCDLELGFVWDGQSCVGLSGCECEGTECDKLFGTFEECREARAQCGGPPDPCGDEGASPAIVVCPSGQAIEIPGSDGCTTFACSCGGLANSPCAPGEVCSTEANGDCFEGSEDGSCLGICVPDNQCPDDVRPPDGCDGTLEVISDAEGCIVGYNCVSNPDCPVVVQPNGNECSDGQWIPILDADNCIIDFECVYDDECREPLNAAQCPSGMFEEALSEQGICIGLRCVCGGPDDFGCPVGETCVRDVSGVNCSDGDGSCPGVCLAR